MERGATRRGGVESGGEWLSPLGQLATERVLQDALAREQTEVLGCHREERCGTSAGYRNGYADGTLKTAEGVLRVKSPRSRRLGEIPRSWVWAKLAKTSDRLKTLCVRQAVTVRSRLSWRS